MNTPVGHQQQPFTLEETGKHVCLVDICKSISGRRRGDDCREEHFHWLTLEVLIQAERLTDLKAELVYSNAYRINDTTLWLLYLTWKKNICSNLLWAVHHSNSCLHGDKDVETCCAVSVAVATGIFRDMSSSHLEKNVWGLARRTLGAYQEVASGFLHTPRPSREVFMFAVHDNILQSRLNLKFMNVTSSIRGREDEVELLYQLLSKVDGPTHDGNSLVKERQIRIDISDPK